MKDIMRDKENIFKEAADILEREGIDPENIWSVKFGIADFIFLSRLSVADASKLLEAIKKDAHGVIHSLGKGLENGLMFDWDTVALTAAEEVI